MEKYKMISATYSQETVIDNEEYYCSITIVIQPTDGIAPEFSKTIEVINNNSQTGYEVDEQRTNAIDNYLIEINK